ncbi:39S ribosomal protein L47, mitochondrial-like, partial [Stegodyphus dumicola]|uniref:39S ribosomal protein L47, mitochondrial-like n=1 Tax=Stegodyphus dumicola TaxID=202533 RepID=UPI0015A88ECB
MHLQLSFILKISRNIYPSWALISYRTLSGNSLQKGYATTFSHNRHKANCLTNIRNFHVSYPRSDLMEFFDDPKNWGEQEVRTGRAWTIDELRIK